MNNDLLGYVEFYSVNDADEFLREFSGSLLHKLDGARSTKENKELFVSERPTTLEYATMLNQGTCR